MEMEIKHCFTNEDNPYFPPTTITYSEQANKALHHNQTNGCANLDTDTELKENIYYTEI